MAITAPGVMAPSAAVVHHIKTLVRTTGWASLASDGRWRAAGVLLPDHQTEEKEGAEKQVKAGQGVMISGKGVPPLPGGPQPRRLEC